MKRIFKMVFVVSVQLTALFLLVILAACLYAIFAVIYTIGFAVYLIVGFFDLAWYILNEAD